MSKFNKKSLAVALAAALTIPAAAFAFTLQTGGDNDAEEVARQLGTTVTMSESVDLVTQIRDVIIGRTTGFQVLITLEDGAQFAAPAVLEPVLAGEEVEDDNGGLVGGWTVARAAGGTVGTSDAQFTVSPNTANATVSEGVILQFANLALQRVRTNGATRMSVELRDPVSGARLHGSTREIITRTDGLAINCEPAQNPARIDVGGEEPRTQLVEFVPGLGYPIGEGDADTTSLGEISFVASGGVVFDEDTVLNSQIMGDFTGIDSVFLAAVTEDGPSCASPLANYTVNAAGTMATLSAAEGGELATGTEFTANLCVTVDGETALTAQTFTVTNGIDGEFLGTACPVAPLQYNGSVVNVYHVNPAGNTTAQSFVRVINPSNLGGRVTINGIDDNGQASAGSVSFELAPRASMQVNSEDLENGNTGKGLTGSLGDGAGKWRLEVTGEFEGMLVQGLNRNTVSGTVTNLTDADAEVEQRVLHQGGLIN